MSDNVFTIHKVVISCKINETINLFPFGDVHYGSPLFSKERWREFLDYAKKQKNTYFLGMGDFTDLLSYTERQIMGRGLHESTTQTIDDLYDRLVKDFCKDVAPVMQGRIIGMLEGNHHGVYSTSGMTTTQKMCEILKARYLGVSSFIRLSFNAEGRSRVGASIDIFAHHGKGGGGRMVGSDINHIQSASEITTAQICLMGHTHKKSIAMKTRLKLNDGNGSLSIAHEKILFGRTGSFLKGWEPDAPSYVVKACMSPTDLGVIKLQLTPRRDRTNGRDVFWIDIHGSI